MGAGASTNASSLTSTPPPIQTNLSPTSRRASSPTFFVDDNEVYRQNAPSSSRNFSNSLMDARSSSSFSSRSMNTASENPRNNMHYGVVCEGCGVTPICGIRYKCVVCDDFNLCEVCNTRRSLFHSDDHNFTAINNTTSFLPTTEASQPNRQGEGQESDTLRDQRQPVNNYICLDCNEAFYLSPVLLEGDNADDDEHRTCPCCNSRFIEQRNDAGLGNSIFSRTSGNSQLPSIDDIEAVLRELRQLQLALAARGSELREAIQRSLAESNKVVGTTLQAIERETKIIRITEQNICGSGRCVVCQEEWVVSEEACSLPCQHLFHKDCAVKWLTVNNSCPVCRTPIEDSVTKQVDQVINETVEVLGESSSAISQRLHNGNDMP